MTTNFLIFKGPSWKNCGASQGQEAALSSDQAFQTAVTNQYKTAAGENQAILTDLTSGLTNTFNAGPSQQGMSPAELAVENSQALNSAASANKQVQQQIGEKAATNGAVPGVESGVVQALRTNAATQVENQLSNQEAQITEKNYDIGRENYLNAEKGLIEAPGAIEGATNQAAGAVNTANKDTSDQANANEAANSQWIGLTEGLASDAATIGSAEIKKCWIAAAVYDGWEDQRVHQVRNYLFNVWANESFVGSLVTKLYAAIGEQVAWFVRRSSILRSGFKALFDIALRKSS